VTKPTTLPNPPEPLSAHERSLTLIKSDAPRPLWPYLLVATLTSLGGIILGFVYLVKDGAENKRFGAAALLLGFVLPLVIVSYVLLDQLRQSGARAPLPNQPGVQLLE
jgi:hypothetical protein